MARRRLGNGKKDRTNSTKNQRNKDIFSNTNQQLKEIYTPKANSSSTNTHTITASTKTWISHLIIMFLAFGAVWFEFTTSKEYLDSKPLGNFLKKCFIAFVCLSSRKIRSNTSKQKKQHLVSIHTQNLLIAICANCAGTSIIQPLFGESPKYASTIEQVIPIYFFIEFLLLCGFSSDLLQGFFGFFVGYMKALTVVKLVVQWNKMFIEKNNPMAFVLICTANLFASGLTIRLIGNYYTCQKNLTWNFLLALIQMMLVSTLFGTFAHFATTMDKKSSMTTNTKQWETFGLYFLIAWYTLDKYWRGSLVQFLVSITSTMSITTTKKKQKKNN
jgi:hypothetical protein